MRNNTAALRHPTIKRSIRRAIWLAKLEAKRKELNGTAGFVRGVQYVQNRKGNNVIRVDWYRGECAADSGLIAYGDQSRNITGLVQQALGLVR